MLSDGTMRREKLEETAFWNNGSGPDSTRTIEHYLVVAHPATLRHTLTQECAATSKGSRSASMADSA